MTKQEYMWKRTRKMFPVFWIVYLVLLVLFMLMLVVEEATI
jgi:uncharacterized membrane protein